jgi:hypothetical protein
MLAPFPDYEGNTVYEGDTIMHPNGEAGVVFYAPDRLNEWRVMYEDGTDCAYALQVGSRGQAVKVFKDTGDA